ncbi:hypothetical protein BC833DRAFT_174409 [Globomyces pollinis-pini]|nr:hypothetical protein BC833DRAFT_174409 [Globomyces pollinis-pini]
MNSLVVGAKASGKNPFTVICYICGREYGSQSIDIHEKQCMIKFESNQKYAKHKLPKPVKPTHTETVIGQVKTDRDAYNEEAFAAYQEQSRVACTSCGRKFNPDSLEKHSRNCKPGGFYDKHRRVDLAGQKTVLQQAKEGKLGS